MTRDTIDRGRNRPTIRDDARGPTPARSATTTQRDTIGHDSSRPTIPDDDDGPRRDRDATTTMPVPIDHQNRNRPTIRDDASGSSRAASDTTIQRHARYGLRRRRPSSASAPERERAWRKSIRQRGSVMPQPLHMYFSL